MVIVSAPFLESPISLLLRAGKLRWRRSVAGDAEIRKGRRRHATAHADDRGRWKRQTAFQPSF
jgi:hypothetical protein